jgi:hypothetical protein
MRKKKKRVSSTFLLWFSICKDRGGKGFKVVKLNLHGTVIGRLEGRGGSFLIL